MGAALLNHLWQSTLFALGAWVLIIGLRHYSARTRYWIWFAVSLKFLIPFSALIALGQQLRLSSAIEIAFLPDPFLSATLNVAEPVSITPADTLFEMIWALGCVTVLARWFACWLRARSLVLAATPHPMDLDIEVRVSPEFTEPGVFGIHRPILLLPSAVVSRLTPVELNAVIAHELCHVRNRDNLIAAVHMLVEAVFWFHPLVWWVGRRLLEERERACDEAVMEWGVAPRIYAESILNACRLSIESRLGVVAGAAGSSLKHRVADIMSWRRSTRKLSYAGKACLVAMASATLVLPLFTGLAMARSKSESEVSHRSQAIPFEFASIEFTPADSRESPRLILTDTYLSMRNTSLRKLISVSAGLSDRQVVGGPHWLDARFDIEATTTSNFTHRKILELLAQKYGLRFIEHNITDESE